MDAKTLAEQHPHIRDADMPIGDRIKAAIQRITHGQASMRVPVEGTDPDIVLADCHILLERQAAELAALRASAASVQADQRAENDKLRAERDALKQTLHDELDSNLRLRELGGARSDEPMTPFLERVFAERDALRAERVPLTARDVAKQVFALCEHIEEQPDSAADSYGLERFTAGQRFAAKQIRRGIGTWLTDEENRQRAHGIGAARAGGGTP